MKNILKERVFIPNDVSFSRLTDAEKHLISLIYLRRVLNNKYESGDYIPLKAEYLRSLYGRFYKKNVIESLCQSGLLEIDNHYIVSARSKGFKLRPEFENIEVRTDYITDRKLILRILKRRNRAIPSYGVAEKFLFRNLHKLEIDKEGAIEFINSDSFNAVVTNRIEIGNQKKKHHRVKEEGETWHSIYNAFLLSILYIADKKFYFYPEGNTKRVARVFNNITSLPRELRRYLHYKGKHLVNIDIRNSQPFLFLTMIDSVMTDTISSKRFIDWLRQNHILHHYFNYNSTTNRYIPSNDVQNEISKYKTKVCEGRFYDELMEAEGIKSEYRKAFKIGFFGEVFFCRYCKRRKYSKRKVFDRHYPFIGHIIDFYKRKGHKNLPIQLQKNESEIIINGIIRRIAIEQPKLFALTIHDSVLTTNDCVEYVKTIMCEEFKKQSGVVPTLNIEQ